ncbi:MAG: AAA family ATPase [Cyanobacteriota bacterium]|nr:AAA family ATPase [Cyanobacteriota bacterium]
MVALAGYKDLILVHESANSQVYRALRVDDLQPIILKFLNQDYPTSEQIRQYKQEYYLTCQLESPGIIKAYSLEKWQKSYAIALEEFGGISLRQWLKEREKLTLQEFLFLAIATTESLAQIHAQHIIHKDINPANIAFNPETKELKIIDFGIATQLSRENPTLKNPNVLEGTLNYISPEQTGRMNRSLDYRTDFYSLGVTFYELLTEKLPYVTEDVLELVHSHLAKRPISPSEIDPLIPPIISEIVMKLMAKNAEDRYQSAYGIKVDLENCLEQLKSTGNIEVFPLANQDISNRFQIPQKLYGREKEIAKLLEAFERVAETGKIELMLVAGYSGIGKSCLVQELYKPITARRGYFISGKFDQFKRNIPYSAIVAAFRGLIGQLLSESQAQLQVWQKKLLKALGKNGQIIIDVIPEVELIIGKQPPVPTLGTNEAQNRFNLVISNFIRACCNSENPLTLFLDDLQWADSGSLKLIEKMLSEGQIEYLFLLGAYRNNEVSPSHPLAITLRKLQQNNNVINKIILKNLPRHQIACLIGDTLHYIPENVCNLAKLVRQKTGGNPFFINEFLRALYRENLLQFHFKLRKWQWNIEEIEARSFTNNVVELMLEKLQKLPLSSQEILSIAACCGTEFDLNILTLVKQKSPQEIYELLKIAIDYDLIFPISELDENLLIQSYKFSHDRIQQAAYLLIPDEQKEKTHYHIGQLLLEKTPPETRVENIFELVSQLNYGIALITDQKQRDELAKLNLIACRKAKTAAAYQASREYANIGLSLLGEKAWSRQYEMTLEFHDAAAELASLCGDFEVMEEFIETVIAQAKSLLEKVNVYRIKILSNVAHNQPIEAIAIAQKILQQLGVTFPKTTTQKNIQHSISEINKLIGDREIEDLVDLPIMTDSEKIAIFQIASSIIPAAYVSGSLLFPLIVSLSVKLSIQYGNTPISALMYAAYGIITCNLLQDVNTGVKFGKLAVGVVSQLDAKAVKPEALQVVAGFILHRKSHVKETLPLLQETYNNSLEVGNQDFAGHCAVVFCLHALCCGYPLKTLKQETRSYCNGLLKLNQLTTANYCRIHWQTILNLSEVTEHPSILSGEVIQETEILSILLSANDLYALYIFYLDKLMLCYLFEEIELAQKSAVEGRQYLVAAGGSFGEPAFYFYDSLIAIATLDLQLGEKSELLHRVEQNQKQLQQQWANYAPMNHQHKVDLVTAEKYRVLGKKLQAMEMYDLAIARAKKNDFIQEEALANELAAKFYLNCSREKIARAYMMDAHYCYSHWGAKTKVKQLEENYPELCQSSTAKTYANSTIFNTEATSNSTNGVILDLATVVKSTNAISGEIVLDKLLATLMNIIIENAGAQRGILILPRGEDLLIEAIKEAESEIVGVLQSLPLHKFKRLSSKIVHYVARTRKTVVLNNATGEAQFTDDTYIRENQCQSIACIPLINQGQLQGIIYLENNLTTGVFTRTRMALLRTLAAQAAISLENARFYDACKRFVPDQFLSFLDKKSIVDVELGDQVERKMTVLFSDIRDFTTISEQMTPAENFAFINEYLGYMEPQIKDHGGFIDKYIGDAIMALFPNSADEAVKGAIAMLEELKKYNSYRQQKNLKPIRIGIGLHTGNLILGTVGGFGRMDGTAIGDAVNLSSRVEGLTKNYRVSLLITHQTLAHIDNPLEYDLRFIDKVKAKGKAKAVGLFEVFSADPPELKETKMFTKEKFETAVMLYHRGSFEQAANLFQECLEYHSGDRAARGYLERCQGHN